MVFNATSVNSTFSTFEIYEKFVSWVKVIKFSNQLIRLFSSSQNSERITDGTMRFNTDGTIDIKYTERKILFLDFSRQTHNFSHYSQTSLHFPCRLQIG